jgi:glutamate synthase domain-containing protein 3
MSGGIAYVLDVNDDFESKCNLGIVDMERIEEDEDISELREMIEQHKTYTNSPVAARILEDWPDALRRFVKVMPKDYKRVLAERKLHDEESESELHDDDPALLSPLEVDG